MKHNAAVWVLVLSLLFIATSATAERPSYNRRTGLLEVPLVGLRKAAERGDRAEMGRWAARIGAARLAKALFDPDRSLALAALDCVPYLPDRLLLLDAVLAQCDSTDTQVGERALRTVGALLGDADASLLDAWDVPDEVAGRACRVLAVAAGKTDRSSDVRLAALQSLADASALCASRNDLSALIHDPSPDVRRAAVLVLSSNGSPSLLALREASKDADPAVAAAAGAALCRQQLAPRAKTTPPSAPARPWRELVLAPGTPAEDASEMLSCLVGSTDPGDEKAIEKLRSQGSSLLRDLATPGTDRP
jgi:HEAT repeats